MTATLTASAADLFDLDRRVEEDASPMLRDASENCTNNGCTKTCNSCGCSKGC
ncbi:hypothetical protein AB0D67_30595 [Streptosporangium sp. NPDC048047]|uniref:hypothetical protein n=1 Tax=Streptosporangium sp. NPDC048047 TaxID=3155748 RepID=UPI00344779AE